MSICSLEQIIFYGFGGLSLITALGMIVSKNTVQSLLLLAMTFLSVAALWLSLGSEFLAIMLLLIYVGAIMVLFLFVVMMIDLETLRLKEGLIRHFLLGLLVAALLLALLLYVLGGAHSGFHQYARPEHWKGFSLETLGLVLYTDYLYPFALVGLLLFVAMMVAIVIARMRAQDPQS